jgi:hypothetical protein
VAKEAPTALLDKGLHKAQAPYLRGATSAAIKDLEDRVKSIEDQLQAKTVFLGEITFNPNRSLVHGLGYTIRRRELSSFSWTPTPCSA